MVRWKGIGRGGPILHLSNKSVDTLPPVAQLLISLSVLFHPLYRIEHVIHTLAISTTFQECTHFGLGLDEHRVGKEGRSLIGTS